MSEPEIVLVVATAKNGVIGRDGDLPWRISSDLKHFKATTMGLPMIMGRRTWASIGKALPGRTTIVVSRDPAFAAEGALTATSLEAALDRARAVAAASGAGVIAVVGGGEIYRQALASADRIELTEVDLEPPLAGAVTFPALDPADWRERSREHHQAGAPNDFGYAFVSLQRVRAD